METPLSYSITLSAHLLGFARERAAALGHEDLSGYVRRLIRKDQELAALEQLQRLQHSTERWTAEVPRPRGRSWSRLGR